MIDTTCIIPCVNYHDFLAISLPTNIKYFSRTIVLTAPNDVQTQEICSEYRVECYPISLWYDNDSVFNKGRALNFGINLIKNSWIISLDADILILNDIDTSILSKRFLYSVKRKLCNSKNDYMKYLEKQDINILKTDSIPIRQSVRTNKLCLWGDDSWNTINDAGVCGYFQMWHSDLNRCFVSSADNASTYDTLFARAWKDDERIWLPHYVIHLGETRTNWYGRRTNYWS